MLQCGNQLGRISSCPLGFLMREAVPQEHVQICQSFLLLCQPCFGQSPRISEDYVAVCHHVPKCFQADFTSEGTPSVSDEAHDNFRTTSTKVKSLITDLLNRNHGDKRSVTVLIAQCLTILTGPKCCIRLLDQDFGYDRNRTPRMINPVFPLR